MPSAEEFGTTADERFDLAYTVALEQLNVTDQPAWKDIVRIVLPEVLIAGGPNEVSDLLIERCDPDFRNPFFQDLTILTKRKALDKINRLKCEGCEMIAIGKLYHEYNQGCKSPMVTRLAAIDLSEAYSEAAADLKSDVLGRVIECIVVEKD